MATYSYNYPATDLDQPYNLAAVLGTFWNQLYGGQDQVVSLSAAYAQVAKQTAQDMSELLQAVNRRTVPVYHKDLWYPLRLRQSQMNTDATALPAYDGAGTYDGGYVFDAPLTRGVYSFPLPDGLRLAPVLFNRFMEPSLVWHAGDQYYLDIERQAIVFRQNPFEDARMPQQSIFENGVVADTELLLWVFRGDFDRDTLYNQFGYVLGLHLPSSDGYRNMLNALFDALVQGCAGRHFNLALSALTGIPLVATPQETVVDIVQDSANLLVLTDVNVYKYHRNDAARVSIGDTVYAGDTLTNAFTVEELNDGLTPAGVSALAIGRGMVGLCLQYDLIFENKDVPLVVDVTDPSGFTKVSFELGGLPLDIACFFDELHTRGVALAVPLTDECDGSDIITWPPLPGETAPRLFRCGTLAHLLDTRIVRYGEPTAEHLPQTINPLQFLIQHILRYNAFIVQIDLSLCGDGAVGLQHARWLKRLCPPHTTACLLLNSAMPGETIHYGQLFDTLAQFTAAEPLSEQVDCVSWHSRSILASISGTCH
jgi:hypothetical protein